MSDLTLGSPNSLGSTRSLLKEKETGKKGILFSLFIHVCIPHTPPYDCRSFFFLRVPYHIKIRKILSFLFPPHSSQEKKIKMNVPTFEDQVVGTCCDTTFAGHVEALSRVYLIVPRLDRTHALNIPHVCNQHQDKIAPTL